jgi:hypothetical protein
MILLPIHSLLQAKATKEDGLGKFDRYRISLAT